MDFAQFDDEFLLNAQIKSRTLMADSGASCHMPGCMDGMINIKDCNDRITIGNGNTISYLVLKDCKYIPDLAPYNFFFIRKAIDAGYKLDNDGRNIILKEENFEMVFNKIIVTKKRICCCHRIRMSKGILRIYECYRIS